MGELEGKEACQRKDVCEIGSAAPCWRESSNARGRKRKEKNRKRPETTGTQRGRGKLWLS